MDLTKGLALLAIAGVLVGCATQPVGVAERKRTKVYANVVSLSPSTTEYLVTGGGSTYLVGRTASCDRPDAILQVPIVLSGTEIKAEKISAAQPDLVIYDKSLFSDDSIAKIEQMGIDTLAYDAIDLNSYADFGYRLGAMLSLETNMSKHIDRVVYEFGAAKANATTNPRVTVLLGDRTHGEYLVMGLEGIHAYILENCGGKPVGAAGKLFQTAKIERLIAWDPEVIYSDGNAQAVYDDPRLQQVAAVKNQRVYDLDARDLVRIGGKLEGIVKQVASDLAKMPVNPRTEG